MSKDFYRFMPAVVDLKISIKRHKDFIKLFYVPQIELMIYLAHLIGWL